MATTLDTPVAGYPDTRWRTRDIVVAAVIGVAFGVVFWIWNAVYGGPLEAALGFFPPLKDLSYAIWLMPNQAPSSGIVFCCAPVSRFHRRMT